MKHVRVWQVAAHLRAALDGDEANWRQERDERLGRVEGDTLLADLLPVPRNIGGDPWPSHYRKALGFADYDKYVEAVLPGRIDLLRSLLKRHQPEFAFCYGITAHERFAALFPAANLVRDEVRTRTGRQQAFLRGRSGKTVVVVTNHYSGGRKPFTSGMVASLLEKIRP